MAKYRLPKTTAPQRALYGRLKRSLWKYGLEPELEYSLDGDRVDIAIPEVKIALEVDGPYHNRWEQRCEDERRDESRRRAGWTPIRATNEEVRNPGLVDRRILAVVRKNNKRRSGGR
jgi:very-short-patch-repair endonuclease